MAAREGQMIDLLSYVQIYKRTPVAPILLNVISIALINMKRTLRPLTHLHIIERSRNTDDHSGRYWYFD